MASSGLAVRKLADGGLLLGCLIPKQCCVLEFVYWAAGRVLCSALCGWGGFGLRKLVLCFRVAVSSQFYVIFCLFCSRVSVPVDVPIYPCIQEVIKWEWRDPDKINLPHFVAKLYPLKDMAKVLPDSMPIDSFVASLVGCTSLAEDAVIQDSVDKKVDVSLRKAYAGTHLALRAGIYGT
ncbi:hypothetical protein NDU88_001026 [Pleurodeles waltl]|uniref:Uncharacterized protein n=1 Tax=Pleurodeles waltl TaxID=8319 RepID=A0AAV7KRS0_PLEWA|nr:hypothetical protein NDU88_001026 [Pleurodeles waltl]